MNPKTNVPENPIPLLPLRDGVLFPGTIVPIPVGRASSIALARTLEPGALIAVGVQTDAAQIDPELQDLVPLATLARVHRAQVQNDRAAQLLVEGLQRVRLDVLDQRVPFLQVRVSDVEETVGDADEVSVHEQALKAQIEEMKEKLPTALQQLALSLLSESDPSRLADRVAGALGADREIETTVLCTLDVGERLKLVLTLLVEAHTVSEVKSKLDDDVRSQLKKGQREAFLREQLKAIQKELGGGDGEMDDLEKLAERLEAKDLPEEVQKVAEREFQRLQAAQGPEQGVIRNYLEWIADLPWTERVEAKTDLDRVEEKLNLDHFGLVDVKQRILEHLAVLEMTGNAKGTILCLAGPPGVGKTSLGQSVADALGRPFVRISLGGVRDEAEIRGHRRTYVGALPGRIMHALKKAGSRNPVMLLDEVDKLGRGWQGDPEAALLEVLDPEQNHTFTDHYMELPFDLSEVLFLCTANDLDQLSAPLRDRLEIIEISGYTTEEKLHIARNHLLPRKLAEHGIHEGMLTVTDEALLAMASGYTREAGVRQLQREITKLCRALALQVARDKDKRGVSLHVDVADLPTYLGKPRFFNEVAERTSLPGVATGLAWTPVGGDILFIETSQMPGKGVVETTGQLGDVMKESARAALTYVRSHAEELGVDPRFLERMDIHIHIPAGAIPKDGPSAGVTMFTALTSLLTGRRVRPDTAMTGEVSLRGRVLPVGGIKSKVLAAHRAGLSRVILPKQNARDLDDVPADVRDQMEFVFAEDMSEVLAAALEEEAAPLGFPRAGAGGHEHMHGV